MGDPDRTRRWLPFGWAMLPLLLGIPAAPCFAWAAYRCRSRALALEAAVYAVATVVFFVLAVRPASSDVGGAIGFGLMLVATGRAFMVRHEAFATPEPPRLPGASPVEAGEPVTWIPPRADPQVTTPALRTPFTCTGNDEHPLSLPIGRTVPMSVGGIFLTYVDIRFHVTGRGLGVAIGLALAPVFAALFSRRVQGPTLYYRTWGRQRSVRLDQVTSVATSSTGRSLLLSGPTVTGRVSVSVQAPHYAIPPAARDHLRGWLERPGDAVSPSASVLLTGGDPTGGAGRKPSRARKTVLNTVSAAALVIPVAIGAWVLTHRAHRAIDGASGYFTSGGPHGKPFALGRPWGTPCQPLLFAVAPGVPDDVYRQLVTVVDEARRDGLNVTTEDRRYRFQPAELTIPPSEQASALPVVAVYASSSTPPRLSSGRRERVGFGWDARVDPDGHHEDLTHFQAHLYLAALPDSAAERLALREVVGFAAGIGHTTAAGSGIRYGSTRDSFSPSDVHAMRLMSGCGG